jgi:hypothetical protein
MLALGSVFEFGALDRLARPTKRSGRVEPNQGARKGAP